jgi:hypothetical protein
MKIDYRDIVFTTLALRRPGGQFYEWVTCEGKGGGL